VKPRRRLEKKLAKIWGEVLSIDPIGIHDNFFDLGGHSLAATRVISRLIQEFHLELPIKTLFESPTVAAMSAMIMQNQENKAGRDDLERILSEVEAMSNEEAERVLKNPPGKVEQ
jgi:acyl carrier protein